MAKNKAKLVPSPSSGSIRFNSVDYPFRLVGKNTLREWIITTAFSEGKQTGFLSYNFCSDKYLLKINRTHLNHDYFTDIITFDIGFGDVLAGDIYVSVERVKENALIHQVTFRDELTRVMIHGVLHLCGYGDKSPRDIKLMRNKEDYYLSLLH
jgi:probable rRNA maturation factor